MLWRIYFPGDFKNRINIHLPGMASVWYCLNKTGHSTLPASELKNSKQIPTCSDLGTKSLPKLPEPSRGEAVSVKQRDFAENDSRLCYDPPPPPPPRSLLCAVQKIYLRFHSEGLEVEYRGSSVISSEGID